MLKVVLTVFPHSQLLHLRDNARSCTIQSEEGCLNDGRVHLLYRIRKLPLKYLRRLKETFIRVERVCIGWSKSCLGR